VCALEIFKGTFGGSDCGAKLASPEACVFDNTGRACAPTKWWRKFSRDEHNACSFALQCSCWRRILRRA
jgi:hypothetical protein